MQYKIQNGVVELSGEPILKEINFEINDNSKIAVVGRNGCGKTTLLKLISGEHKIVKLDSDQNSFIAVSGKPIIGFLSQMTFEDDNRTLLEEVRSAYKDILTLKEAVAAAEEKMSLTNDEDDIKEYTNLLDTFTNLGGFYFEKEYEAAIKKFGFSDSEKQRKLYEFSGGQRTKIAFLKLLLSKPDILLLDEPTNHLDVDAKEELKRALLEYKGSVLLICHEPEFYRDVVNEVWDCTKWTTKIF
jgi:ATP-binding cassette subfamily F protein 3